MVHKVASSAGSEDKIIQVHVVVQSSYWYKTFRASMNLQTGLENLKELKLPYWFEINETTALKKFNCNTLLYNSHY